MGQFVRIGKMERRMVCLLAAVLMADESDTAESVAQRAEEFEVFVEQAFEHMRQREAS